VREALELSGEDDAIQHGRVERALLAADRLVRDASLDPFVVGAECGNKNMWCGCMASVCAIFTSTSHPEVYTSPDPDLHVNSAHGSIVGERRDEPHLMALGREFVSLK
jgi:hypothetical protein